MIKKRLFLPAFILLAAVAAVLLCGPAVVPHSKASAAETPAVWDGTAAVWHSTDSAFPTDPLKFGAKKGSKDNPWLISTPEQLALLSDLIYLSRAEIYNPQYNTTGKLNIGNTVKDRYNNPDVYYRLTTDIWLNDVADAGSWNKANAPANSWLPIGSRDYNFNLYVFKANFDGHGHVVHGLYINLEEDVPDTKYCYLNMITPPEPWDPDWNTFDYIRQYPDYLGLFGRVSGTVKNLGIEEGFVRGKRNIGGIAGQVLAGGKIVNCYNAATVVAYEHAAGGIAGGIGGGLYFSGPDNTWYDPDFSALRTGSVESCYNIGKVTGDTSVNGAVSGGIGGIGGHLLDRGNIIACYNTGAVTAGAISGGFSGGGTGGIAGMTHRSTHDGVAIAIDEPCISIKNSFNKGSVDGYVNVGGIIGYGGTYDIIDNCYNTGGINKKMTSDTDPAKYLRAGGIAGAGGRITNSYNLGEVLGNSCVGGIAGFAGHVTLGNERYDAYIANCFNHGSIRGRLTDAGGIAGFLQGTAENCYSSGAVNTGITSCDYAGAACGKLSGVMKNCYAQDVAASNLTDGAFGKIIGGMYDCGQFQDPPYEIEERELIDCPMFNSDGVLTHSLTVGITAASNLFDALTAWLSAHEGAGLGMWVDDKDSFPFLTFPEYTVTYDLSGKNCTGIPTQTVSAHTIFEPVAPAATGYTFLDWYSLDGELFVGRNFAFLISHDMVLEAEWQANSYVVAYNANQPHGVNLSGSMPNITFYYDEPKALSSNKFSVEGHSFLGWAESAAGAKIFDDAQEVINIAEGGTKNLYAVWKSDNIVVTFLVDGAVYESVSIAKGASAADAVAALSAAPAKAGYRLLRWEESVDETTGGIALTAVWTPLNKSGLDMMLPVLIGSGIALLFLTAIFFTSKKEK